MLNSAEPSALNDTARAAVKTLLVSMPFFSVYGPSLQICGLAAVARSQGFPVDTAHLNLAFARKIGVGLYEDLVDYRGHEIGNWLFAAEAFPEAPPDPDNRLPHDFPEIPDRLKEHGLDIDGLVHLRRETVSAFLAELEESIAWSQYAVVGFSSTFQQNTPSFALARRLKQRWPHLVTLFGGANFEGEMGDELLRGCSFIDLAVDGEGDAAFPAVLAAIAAGHNPRSIAGVVSRDGRGARPPLADLARAPPPDFAEYFERIEALQIISPAERRKLSIPFEGSRGCWWGEKHHCTFCGLNGQTMKFRQKPAADVLDEIGEVARRFGVFSFAGVDNIMAPDFFRDFVPRLIASERNYDFFVEIKSNLSRSQIKALAEAGVTAIQPGIESLSTPVLRLMRKGVRAIQNVNLLRWARHFGVEVRWNVLYGFPGEQPEHYEAQTRLFPHLVHLEAPNVACRIWMERFSPIFKDRDLFPTRRVEPRVSLKYIYPPTLALDRIAYFFDYEFEDHLPDETYADIETAVDAWQKSWEADTKPWLTYRWSPGIMQIEDGRQPANPLTYNLPSPLAEIYRAISERPLPAATIANALAMHGDAGEIAEALDLFVEKGLVMREDDLYLALAIPERPHSRS